MDAQIGRPFLIEARRVRRLQVHFGLLRPGGSQEGFGGVTNSLDGVGVGAREKLGAGFGEVCDHLCTDWGVVKQGTEGGGQVCGGEALVDEFRDNAAASDEIRHRNG